MRKNERGITLIALVVTIVVLIILAGISISMLTGENGIVTRAQESKLQTEIGKEKEYITLSVSAVRGDKIAKGDTSEITSGELQNEINNYTNEATVTGRGTLVVTYESGRSYEVEQDGSITQKEELTPEEAKKIVNATGYIGALLVETADGTVYYVDDLQEIVMQKIGITDAEIITTNGIRKSGSNYFIDDKGKVYTWGDNYNGQLGNATNEDSDELICISDIPENALNGKNIVEMQSGDTMIAIDSEGKVYTWGDNYNGQLGNGTDIEYSNEPICISGIAGNALNGKNIVEVQSGDTMIAIDSEGKVYTWGDNYNGQLGNGTDIEYSNEPICISGIAGNALNGKDIVEIQSGGYTIIAIDSEGKVYTWGGNYNGQLGNGTDIEYSNEPICISGIDGNALNGKNIVEVQSGDTMIAIDSEGKVYTWGDNYNGQLGNGTDVEYANAPICISDTDGNALNGKNIVEVQSYSATEIYDDTIIALDSEGKVYTWGENKDGALGNGTYKESNIPICISDIPENELYNKKIKFINITFTYYNVMYKYFSFITENGELYNYYESIPLET